MKPIYRYKLTTQNMTTHGGFKWEVGKWVKTSGKGDLCGPGWLHAYDHPLLAALHNPIHADIENPRLWKCEVRGKEERDGQMKCGWTEMRLVEELPLPYITIDQSIRYGILCAREVCRNPVWNKWADNWLSGKNRATGAAVTWTVVEAGSRASVVGAAEWACAAKRSINLIKIAQKAVGKK